MSIDFYRWRRRKTAFRNDYCMSCQRKVVAFQFRSFVVMSVKHIPVLPLGFWKQWECRQCGIHPSVPKTARTSILLLGAVTFGLFGIVAMCAGIFVEDAETGPLLGIGAGFTAASVALFSWCWTRRNAVGYRDRFAAVAKSTITVCPKCRAEMTEDPESGTAECDYCYMQRL